MQLKRPRKTTAKKPKILEPKKISYSVTRPYRYQLVSTTYGAVSSPTQVVYSSVYTSSRVRSGQTNPKWREQIRMGQNAATPLTASFTKMKADPGLIRLSYLYNGQLTETEWDGNMAGYEGVSFVGSLAAAEQSARQLFYKKLRQKQAHFAGEVFLGELREGIQLIRKPFKGLQRLVSRWADRQRSTLFKYSRRSHRGRRAELERRIDLRACEKELSDAWLELSFGALPLVSDVHDAAETLASLLMEDDRFIPVRVVAGSEGGSRETFRRSYVDPTNTYAFVIITRALSGSAMVKYCSSLKVSGASDVADWGHVSRVTGRFGLTLSEFVPTLWELCPWSFLLDYVATVGDVVNAWACSTADVQWYVRTETQYAKMETVGDTDVAYTRSFNGPAKAAWVSGRVGSSLTEQKSVVRSIPTGIALPALTWDVNLSPMKLLNIAALRRSLVDDIARSPTLTMMSNLSRRLRRSS